MNPPPPQGTTAPGSWPQRWLLGGQPSAAVGSSTVHLLLDLPVGIVTFVATVVLGALSLGLLVLYPVALLVLVAFAGVVRGLAAFERGRVGSLLGVQVPAPPRPTSEGSWHTRLWTTLRHPSTWRAVAHHLLRLPLGVAFFVLAVAAWTFPLGLVVAPLSLVWSNLAVAPMWALAPFVLAPFVGLALLGLSARVVVALADLDAAIVAGLLGMSQADRRERRIERLSTTRSDLVDIAEQERRRIERDLHDGAGQQLVSLAMTLGRAREKMRQDPASAQDLIDEAHAEAKEALVGLRDIVRGISPAILTDRGLGAALSAVAARAAVPVTLDVDVPERPDPVTEGIAYYVVCEAIGNAIRHAEASEITVTIVRRDDVLDIEVRDDGRGGVDPDRGTGVRGLAGRVAAVDGDLQVTSPQGGPTVVHATLPIRTADVTAVDDTARGR